MLLNTKFKPVLEQTFSIGRFLFYENFIVGECHEGVHVTKENAAEAILLAQEIYGAETPLIYISNRLHSYSVDPVGFQEVAKIFPNFKGSAIVSANRLRRMTVKFEKLFIKQPVEVFHNLEKAFEWGEALLNSKN